MSSARSLPFLASVVLLAACSNSSAPGAKLPVYVDFPPDTCAVGRTICGAGCVDPLSHPQNCGICDSVCPANQACVGGICTATCPRDTTSAAVCA